MAVKLKKKTIKLHTERLGDISQSKLNKLIKAAGSQARLAIELGVPSSTVRNWSLALRRLNGQ